MKKNKISYNKVFTFLVFVIPVTCSLAWMVPSFAPSNKNSSSEISTKDESNAGNDTTTMSEENQLVHRLENDGIISQINGFVVEKRQNTLFIDGKKQPDKFAGKYIAGLKKDVIWVEVYPFMERLRMHPDAGFMQILLPTSLSSPCVDTHKTKKPGC